MNLNEQELNYILSECMNNLLTEGNAEENERLEKAKKQNHFQYKFKNQQYGLGNDYEDDTVKPAGYTYYNTTKKTKKSPLIKGAGKAIGGFIAADYAGSVIGSILSTFGGGMLGGVLSNVISISALAIIGGIVAKSLKRNYFLKNLKIPKSLEDAKRIAMMAASERAVMQEQCKILQYNYKNAQQAHNELFASMGKEYLLSWSKLSKTLKQNSFTLSRELGGGAIKVNADTNFNNKNVTENKLYEATFTNDGYATNKFSVDDFKDYFESKGAGRDLETSVATVYGIAQLYADAYKIWYEWTRYIQVLIKYFPENLKWNDIVNYVGEKYPNGMSDDTWDTILQTFAPRLATIKKGIEDIQNNKKRRKNIEQDIYNTWGDNVTVLEVVDANFDFEDVASFYLFTDYNDTSKCYALKKDDTINLNLNEGDFIKIKNLQQYVHTRTIQGDDDEAYKLLNKKVVNAIVEN